jgi:hypothetical protein
MYSIIISFCLKFLKKAWPYILIGLIALGTYIYIKTLQSRLEEAEKEIQNQSLLISSYEEQLRISEEALEVMEKSWENQVVIEKHYEKEIINNKEVIKEFHDSPQAEENQKKILRELLNRFKDMK